MAVVPLQERDPYSMGLVDALVAIKGQSDMAIAQGHIQALIAARLKVLVEQRDA